MQDAKYVFHSQPRPVQTTTATRSKYRQPEDKDGPLNIMHDPRVVRGSTYSARHRILQAAAAAATAQQQQGQWENTKPRSRNRQRRTGEPSERVPTPEPVPGRQHGEAQTTVYLEELADYPQETENATQTDPSKDRPVSPLFVPRPSGESKSTTIESGDLFDFDLEVVPIIEVLVGKSLHQGLMEVLEEEELKAVQHHRLVFEQKRNAAVAVAQQLEAAEKRRKEERERRVKQAEERAAQEQRQKEIAAAKLHAKDYLLGLQNRVVDVLDQQGFFYDPLVREVERQFMPWLLDTVVEKVDEARTTRALVDSIILSATKQLQLQFDESERLIAEREAARLKAEQEEIARKLQEEEERKAKEAAAKAEAEAKAKAEADGQAEAEASGEGDEEEEEEEN